MKTLVAFSGTIKDDGVEYTESDMNKIKESELPRRLLPMNISSFGC